MNKILKKISLGILTLALLIVPVLATIGTASAQTVYPLSRRDDSNIRWDKRGSDWWTRNRSVLLLRTESGRVVHPSRVILIDDRTGERLVLRNNRFFSSRLVVEVEISHRAFVRAENILDRRNVAVVVDARRDLLIVGGSAFRILDLDIMRRW